MSTNMGLLGRIGTSIKSSILWTQFIEAIRVKDLVRARHLERRLTPILEDWNLEYLVMRAQLNMLTGQLDSLLNDVQLATDIIRKGTDLEKDDEEHLVYYLFLIVRDTRDDKYMNGAFSILRPYMTESVQSRLFSASNRIRKLFPIVTV